MPFTKRISIERYKQPTEGYGGLIEGETDDGQRWVMYVDQEGRPDVFWPSRDETGAVQGAPVQLVRQQTSWAREGGHLESLAESVMAPVGGEKIVSTFPVFTGEVWPRNEGDDPTVYTGLQRGVVFCVAQEGENPADAMRRFVKELHEYYIAEERTNGGE